MKENYTSNEKKPKIVVFYITDPALVELEWVLPIMREFASSSYEVVVIFLEPPRDDMQQFFLEIVKVFAIKILSLDNFEPLPLWILRILRKIRRLNKILSIFTSIYFTTGSLGKIFGILRWRRISIYNALNNWLAKNNVFAFIHSYKKKEAIPSDAGWLPWYWVIHIMKKNKVPIVGCPPAVAVTVIKEDYMMPHDLTIVTREEQANFLNKKREEPVVAIGTPQFEDSWISFLLESYEKFKNIEKILPKDRKLVLVVLKNDTSIVWEGINFEKTTKSLLEQLSIQKKFLIIKPHPRQTMKLLKSILKDFSLDDYLIDFGPISFWASRADITVALFSGGALHPLASGKIPIIYWPISKSYREAIDKGLVNELYINHDSDGRYNTQYDDFAIVVKKEKLLIENVEKKPYLERFEKTFNPVGSSKRFREACENFLHI